MAKDKPKGEAQASSDAPEAQAPAPVLYQALGRLVLSDRTEVEPGAPCQLSDEDAAAFLARGAVKKIDLGAG